MADLPIAVVGLARTEAATGEVEAAIDRLSAFVERTPFLGAVSLLGELERFAGRTDTTVRLLDTIATLQRASGAVVDLELKPSPSPTTGRLDAGPAQVAHAERPSGFIAPTRWRGRCTGSTATPTRLPYVAEATRLGTADAVLRYHVAAILAGAGQPERARAELAAAFATNPFFSFGLRASHSPGRRTRRRRPGGGTSAR